ncbi:MAG: ATP synthase F0 subunit B [Deltaproteobacteria bacterium]|nr:ATP synthase F0 subunit B [Deltaproteobacteria bacterium]
MEIVENVALISINATLAAQMVSFLIFLFLINRLMFAPLREVMAERQGRMDSAEQEISLTREKMEKIRETLAAQEAEARARARKTKERLSEEGGREAERILAAAREKIEKTRQETAEKVEQEIARVREYLDAEAKALAGEIMEKILGRSIQDGSGGAA